MTEPDAVVTDSWKYCVFPHCWSLQTSTQSAAFLGSIGCHSVSFTVPPCSEVHDPFRQISTRLALTPAACTCNAHARGPAAPRSAACYTPWPAVARLCSLP